MAIPASTIACCRNACYRNPYLLPNVVGTALALGSLPLVLLFLQDTEEANIDNPA